MANDNDKSQIDNPFTADPDLPKKSDSQPNLSQLRKVEPDQPKLSELVKVEKGLGGHLKDFGASLASGAASVPDIAIGLGDIYTGGRAGKAVADSGLYDPGSGSKYWADKKTINSKSQQQQFSAADGVIDKTKVALSNPSMILNAVGESLAPMAIGGLAGRAVNVASKGAIGAAAAGAIGEGAVMAGSQAESIRQETKDGLLTPGQVAASAATGVAGGAFGYLGGRIAQKFGFDDIDNLMANGVRSSTVHEAAKDIPLSSIPKSILAGAVSEGILEELPQSLSEQALQNIALGKDWYENLDDAAVMGTLAGMAMGGGINAYKSTQNYLNSEKTDPNQNPAAQNPANPNLPQLPSGDNSLTGEYIPRADQATQPGQGRTIYEYDQFSTDADNQLNQSNNNTDFGTPNSPNGNGPDTPSAPNGNYFDTDAAFDDLLNTHPPVNQTPSQQMGINPTDGPMSTAAALAVDSGVSSAVQQPTAEQQKNGSLFGAMPSNYQSLLGSENSNAGSNTNSLDQSGIQSTGSINNTNLNQIGTTESSSNNTGSDNQVTRSGIPLEQPNTTATNEIAGTQPENAEILSDATSTKQSAQSILGADGQNKWFASQDKANTFIEKKKLDENYHVVEADKNHFEIRPKQSSVDIVTPAIDKNVALNGAETLEVSNKAVTNKSQTATAEIQSIDSEIQTTQQQLDSEKSIPKKVHLQKQIESLKAQRADITTQEQSKISVQKKATSSSFQTQPLDHGALNVPLSKRGNIDAQLDQYKKEQAVIQSDKRDLRNINHGEAQEIAKPMFEALSNEHIKEYASKAGIKLAEAKKELKSMAHWQPQKAVKVFEALNNQTADDAVAQGVTPTLQSIDNEIQTMQEQLDSTKSVPQKMRLQKKINELTNTRAANAAATSSNNDLPKPTQAQIEAGNYKKGHIKVHGLDISVENPKGSERRGTSLDGKKWIHIMSDHYGYIKRTNGADDEHIDTYVGKNPESEKVYVVDQIDQGTDDFDEHKVMMGFDSQKEAVAAYQSNFDKGWKVGPVREMNKDEFKDWLKNENTKKPASDAIQPTAINAKEVTPPISLKDSIENIRAEKIRAKTVVDIHRLYGNANESEIEKSISNLEKSIQKQHEKSLGEMSSGKRNTRKAVASGAVDNFRKQKMDLEVYLKARKLGEVKQNSIANYSKDKLKPDSERKGTSSLDTIFGALSRVSATRQVLSILEHLKLTTTQDASARGRIVVRSRQWVGVDKVGNLNTHGFTIQVVDSFHGLPLAIQEDATYQNEQGNTQNYVVNAVWHDGNLYVNAGDIKGDSSKQLTTFEAYQETLMHEIVGHFGVQKIFGNEYKNKLQQLYKLVGGIDGIRNIAQQNGVDMQQFENTYIEPYTQAAKDGIYTETDVQQALVGELFAFVAQNQHKQPLLRNKLKEVFGYIRQWLSDHGFMKLAQYTDADIAMFLAEARKAVADPRYFGKFKKTKFSNDKNSDQPLFSRKSSNQSTGKTMGEVRQKLVDRFGKGVIATLEKQGKLRIVESYEVEGVEGFYQNGQAVLVADNLTNESIVPTFLHELGGHAGFQNMMNQDQYYQLMRQFNGMVERGNPIAIEAKKLAERESGSDRQKLEYLPYLITLSSTMQESNVSHKNAVQKLIGQLVSYVKAWAFDKLGMNIELSPQDMVALSERMVKQLQERSSLDKVRQKYLGTSQWMQAPNGKPTNLSEQQWLQVRTPEFKGWFGDWETDSKNSSEVLDKNGEPKVVYHGTAKEFTEFKLGQGLLGQGIYLTDNQETADMYANIRSADNKGIVMPLFANIRNPFKSTDNVSRDEIVKATDTGKHQGVLHSFEGNEFLVALKPNQVKMAIGNAGTFDSNDPSVLFSRQTDQMKDILNSIVINMNKQGAKKLQQQAAFKFKGSLGYLLQGLGRRQLTDVYSKILPQLKKYNDIAAQMEADKNEAGAYADELVVRWAKIKDEQQLAELMHEATLAKIDPDKPYVSGDSVARYKQLRDDLRSLSPEAQQMYRDARDAYKKHHRDVLGAIKERIMRASIASAKKAELMKQMDDNFFHGLKGVYFPLSRFGKYVIIVRKSNGEVESVNRAETLGEADALRNELIKMFPHANVEKVIRDKEFNADRDMVGRGFMSNLFEELDKFGLSASKQAELEDILGQLYLSSLPDLSWAKHGIHRKGTAGFSQDARRAFAQNMFHGASYLAKLRYADVMVEQLDEMQKHADSRKNNDDYDQPVAQAVIDEMNKRHKSLMSPDSNPLSSALTSVGFIYFLGLSVASGAVNLLQTVLVAYPQMGAKWGFDAAANELRIAAAQSAKGLNDISKSLQGNELKAYNEAVRRGVIDVTQAHDLAGIAQGEDSGVMWKLRPIMRWASFIFHQAERFNREVTFVAAYRLATKAGAKHDDAFEQAMKSTYDGHFDYSSGNRPRVMQGNVQKVIFLFKQFGQNMLYTMLRSLHQSFKGGTPAARREALRAFSGIMATHTVFAGTLGLPLVGMLLGLISFFGSGDDEPWDAETALKNNLSDILGTTTTDVLMNGVSRLTPWDISGRVGIDNLIIPETREGLEGQDKAQAYVMAGVGPIGGILVNIMKGFQEIGEGHGMRGLETMSPSFLRGPLRSIRYADEGAQDKTGVSIKDDVGIMGVIGQAAGFAPSEVRLATEGRSAVYKLQKRLDERRSSLMTQFARAKMNDDQEGMDKAWQEIQKFNEGNPSRRINKMQALQSYRTRKKRIDTAENGMVIPRKKRDDLNEGRFAFDD